MANFGNGSETRQPQKNSETEKNHCVKSITSAPAHRKLEVKYIRRQQ
jgi:hypothetical protein